jgi:hypothetical protein
VSLRGSRIKRNPTANATPTGISFKHTTLREWRSVIHSLAKTIHLNWTASQKTLLAMLGAFALAILLIAAMYSRW